MSASIEVSSVITIDRSKPFDLIPFKIVDQDERSVALATIDVNAISFESVLKEKEGHRMKGEERLRILKDKGRILLDAQVLMALLENSHLIPERFKEMLNQEEVHTSGIYFDGTILQGERGDRYVLYLSWRNDQWTFDICSMYAAGFGYKSQISAVL